MVQQNAARLEHPISRYASCTPGVVDLCVRAVAAEGGLEGVIPDWSGREVALVARGALEALELTATLGDRLMDRELGKGEGDWALTVLAELRFFVSGRHWDRKQEAPARAAGELALAPIEDAAASDDRSPVLFYHDVFFDAAQALVRRGDRMGLVRQLECVAETLHESRTSMTNVLGAVRDLALFHLDLGEHREGLSLLSGLLRHRHSDPWTYNAIAMRFARYGLPSLGRLAAERCLALIRRDGDPERLEGQLREFIREIGSAADRSDAPEDAVKELRDALHVDFADDAPVSPAELADRLLPAAATARVKQLPPRPSDGELSRMAERLRGFLRSERAAAPRPAAAESAPTPAAARRAAKVGRNDPCPCGSGRKFKKCCLE